jgi:hypothetical protein
VARFGIHKKGVFRIVAIALLAVFAGFTFPESHYSEAKTFIKSPSPQAEICSILCDDVEDSNDYSTGANIIQNAAEVQFAFSLLHFSSANSIKQTLYSIYEQVYILHRQLLI